MCTCLATIQRIFLTLLSMVPIIISVVSADVLAWGRVISGAMLHFSRNLLHMLC